MLELIDISKDYLIDKKPFTALKNIRLTFPKQQFCTILGPSGCGKTTLLNIIGGLDRYTSGDIKIDGVSTKTFKDSDWDNYRNKKIGFVFQSYNLVSHLTILDNVELALTLSGIKKTEREKKARKVLDSVGLKGIYRKKPNQLSGGQMQRVAIARALINDPEIILADEPTGALDSKTSIQIMDILKDISKEKLVIMVTHNKELANKYADRIINFKDGEVENDDVIKSNVLDDDNFQIKLVQNKKNKKASMSFSMASSLSLKNLWNKKLRTVLTAVASSFGIIGVALVLALNNGFNTYMDKLQSETASSLPITVSAYTVKSVKDSTEYNQNEKYPDAEEVYPYIDSSQYSQSTIQYNNINENYITFLETLRDKDELINDYLINYYSGYNYHLMTDYPKSISGEEDDSGVMLVNTAYSSSSITSVIGSVTGLPTTIFHSLYGQEKYIRQNYDLIAGKYPQEPNELVLVVDSYNRINFKILQRLGFYNSNDTYLDVYDENLKTNVKPISWDDILNKKYKVFNNDEYYDQNEAYSKDGKTGYTYTPKGTNRNDEDSEAYLKKMFNDSTNGTDLKITGILRPSKSSTISLMSTGLCYLSSFQEKIVSENSKASLNTGYLDNLVFKDDSVDEDENIVNFANALYKAYQEIGSTSTSSLKTPFNEIYDEYFDIYYLNVKYQDSVGSKTTISYFLSQARAFGIQLIDEELKTADFTDQNSMTKLLTEALLDHTKFYTLAISLAAYVNNYSEIASLIIFPKDLTSKSELLEKLDDYNNISTNKNDVYHAHSSSDTIYYSDYVGEVAESLTLMINIISVVLIVFASISLVVSCVMTGIITYNGVIERTKEIGILRAIGARKKDVGILFETECILIGFGSGVIGCLFAYILCIPINLIINAIYSEYNIGSIANFAIYHALILIVISMVLTFVSGFIPARAAARKDPVLALRSND